MIFFPSSVKTFQGMVYGLDIAVGTIEKALADAGMLEESVIAFASDNGAEPGDGSSNYPFRCRVWTRCCRRALWKFAKKMQKDSFS